MNATTVDNVLFCDLKTFQTTYKSVHGYLSLIVCVFGSVANVLNVCVLSTKQMRWPTNFILTGLAIADLMVMLEYIPFVSHEYLNAQGRSFCTHYTYKWAAFTVFHALFTQVFHFISCALTVILAVWRYIALTYPQNNKIWCSSKRTIYTIILTYLLCPLICLPVFLSLKIQPVDKPCDQNHHMLPKIHNATHFLNETIYVVMYTSNQSNKIISFWVYGVVIKLVPCILLTLLSWKLINVLLETKKRRKNLLNSSTNAKKMEKEQQTDRTTRMLLAVLLMFLVTEFPQAILGLLSAVIGEKFEMECYVSLGDLMDILALTNSAISFILYCSVSQQFRTAFKEMFTSFFPKKKPPAPAKEGSRETAVSLL